MTSNVNKTGISNNSSNSSYDSKTENEFLADFYKIKDQRIKNKELFAEKAEEGILSHSHPAVSAKKKEVNLLKDINSKQLKSTNFGTQSKKIAPGDSSFSPEKEFLKLNSQYLPVPTKKLEKSSKFEAKYKDTFTKNKSENPEFFADPDEKRLSIASDDSFVIPSLEVSISEDEDIIRPSKKKHNFNEKPIVRTSPHFLQIEHERTSKPYGPYQPHKFTPNLNKKSSLKTNSSLNEKQDLRTREIFEPQPGTSKMESDYEFLKSDASVLEKEEKFNQNSLKINKPFSDFSLQEVKLTLGFEIDPHKIKKVRIGDTIKISIEKLGFSDSENEFQLKFVEDNPKLQEDYIKECNDQDPSVNEVQLDKSLKAFSERKEKSYLNVEENNVIEEDDALVFSWSSSDLGITRWSLPSSATTASNLIVNGLSVNYVLDSIVKRFIDVRQLAPITYSQRPTRNSLEIHYDEQIESQEASVSHLNS